MHLNAKLVELLGYGVSDSAAYAAAYDSDLLQTLCLCGSAEGANEVLKAVALIEVIELFCCSANYLENDSNGALLAVKISDSEGDTLSVGVCP